MRRCVIEWAIVFTMVATAAIALVWIDSSTLQFFKEPLGSERIYTHGTTTTGSASSVSSAMTGSRRNLASMRRTTSWARSYTTWFFPGIEFHHRRMASGHAIWSLEIAPVWPAACALVVLLALWRLRGSHAESPTPSRAENAVPPLSREAPSAGHGCEPDQESPQSPAPSTHPA